MHHNDRMVWLRYLNKTAGPVLSALAADRLRADMPVVFSPRIDDAVARHNVSYLEAWGRTLSGIGPWLNKNSSWESTTNEEEMMLAQYRQWALKAVANSVNQSARDYMQWSPRHSQAVVDAAFFALGLLRCPWLWDHLDPEVKANVLIALAPAGKFQAAKSNWVLFPAIIELCICIYGGGGSGGGGSLYKGVNRTTRALLDFSKWYKGDGTFSDGEFFHNDYYNSYVIQPFLGVILSPSNKRCVGYSGNWKRNLYSSKFKRISERYAEIQERTIGADGSFPVTGRSITYRGGAFHHLADMALKQALPPSLPPGQVRSALTAVLKRTLGSPNTFTSEGWLQIGLAGHQPRLADSYITSGSLYLCTVNFLPLGLPPSDPFWTSPSTPWTAVRVWGGEDIVGPDHFSDK